MKLEEEGNIRIIEKITDDYGTAIKYSDGTMIVTQSYDVTISSSDWTSWGSLFIADCGVPPTFPAEFIEVPRISYGLKTGNNFNGWLVTRHENGTATTTCSGPQQILRGTTANLESFFTIDVIAIGKWK